VSAHARNLQLQGAEKSQVDAVATGQVDLAKLTPKDRALLRYVEELTLRPADMSDAQTQAVRAAGWKDEELFEAAFVTSLFAFFNRMADAYGLDYAAGGWRPPAATTPAPTDKPTP
jgi:alkylhydroperoxidase family enzyme